MGSSLLLGCQGSLNAVLVYAEMKAAPRTCSGHGAEGPCPLPLPQPPPTSDEKDPDKHQSTHPILLSSALRACHLSCQKGTCLGGTLFGKKNYWATAMRLRLFHHPLMTVVSAGMDTLLRSFSSHHFGKFRPNIVYLSSWLEGATKGRGRGCPNMLALGSPASSVRGGIGFCCS